MADETDRENDGPQGGAQLGGAPGASDMAAPGGSSGTGGYGNDMNTQDQQSESGEASDHRQSRGERYDEAQGGGRDADTVSVDEDRGQAAAGDEEVE